MIFLLFFIFLLKFIDGNDLLFNNTILQRFIYDEASDTIVLAAVNHLYLLNSNDFEVITDVDLSSPTSDRQCLASNKTTSSTKLNYFFSISSYLQRSENETFNQLLLFYNDSILACSTLNRGSSCQLRSLIDLEVLKNSSQRLVSSSPFYPSVGFISRNSPILYLSNTYDPICDPFYENPTISGRHLSGNHFLSPIHFNTGQSALQQSTYQLRLLNLRLVKEFFLHYIYGFEYKHFSYFLTIQQSDLHHKYRLQSKIVRFCQTWRQPMMKSYVEIPLTCGQTHHYLITAKYSPIDEKLYGLFRNTSSANRTTTSHAICHYTIDQIQEAFYQTIKHCLVDGKGSRGLGFLSPDTHCVSSKTHDEIDHDYCPDHDDQFFQYPIGGHRPLEQNQPIIEFYENVNFTSIEISPIENDTIVIVGDDHGAIRTFQASNNNEILRQEFPSTIVIDMKLIHTEPDLNKANLIVLGHNQIIRTNLTTCEQYSNCEECSIMPMCHWCSTVNRCAPTFDCVHEKKRLDSSIQCTNIEHVHPERFSLEQSETKLEVSLNVPLTSHSYQYQCRFHFSNTDDLFHTNITFLKDNRVIRCTSPELISRDTGTETVILSIYDPKQQLAFGHYPLLLINCTNIRSCSACNSYSDLCLWNLQMMSCINQNDRLLLSPSSLSSNINRQCPLAYVKRSTIHLTSNTNATLTVLIDQCNNALKFSSCQLRNAQHEFVSIAENPILNQSNDPTEPCQLICSFQLENHSPDNRLSYKRPFHLDLTIHFPDHSTQIVPQTRIYFYDCKHLAFNCTSCSQLDAHYGCIWCDNMCKLKGSDPTCTRNERCRMAKIRTVEPTLLPISGGTLVTIQGKDFDLEHLSIDIAGVPCLLIQEESSPETIVCRSGDAGSMARSGFLRFQFGINGPEISSDHVLSYTFPIIDDIEPLIGIESGGTLLTIRGSNLTIGNGHLSIIIGQQLCSLQSVSDKKIQCETNRFPKALSRKQLPIKIIFDRRTQISYRDSFVVAENPLVYSFDRYHHHRSFRTGGHRLTIFGENFHLIQNVQLEFQQFLFVSPLFRNSTHLKFVTPSTQELQLNQQQQQVDITLHLDNFMKNSTLIYFNDPMVFSLAPRDQSYSERLIIYGRNLTDIGHSKNDIHVHIGCDRCEMIDVQFDKIICQPPSIRPAKISQNKELCYESQYPNIIVTIDNLRIVVGSLIYPRKVFVIGIISGCLVTLSAVILLILLISMKKQYLHRKHHQRYFYANNVSPQEIEKEDFYQKYLPIDQRMIDSASIPIRSYVNYLQVSYYAWDRLLSIDSKRNFSRQQQEMIDQFQYFTENNYLFVSTLLKHLFQSKPLNKKILTNLILTQRYNLRTVLMFDDESILMHICLLTFYQIFSMHPLRYIFSQLYSQLKFQILQGPIDAIQSSFSFYSLDSRSMLNDRSVSYTTIRLMVHLNSSDNELIQSVLVTCLTADTISQVKEKILQQCKPLHRISASVCQLYLIANPSCPSSSCSSSSSSGSSSVPLTRKSMLTEMTSHRTMKYSTLIIRNDSNYFFLDDIDHSNQQTVDSIKLNTLQHYGIVADGHEFRFIIPKHQIELNTYPSRISVDPTVRSPCHHCVAVANQNLDLFRYLSSPPKINSIVCSAHDTNHKQLVHLISSSDSQRELTHDGSPFDEHSSRTARLLKTKLMINSNLNRIIEFVFTDIGRSDAFLSELLRQNSRLLHIFYAHFIPFLFQHIYCLFDVSIDTYLNSSLDILAMIFSIGCNEQSNEFSCLWCTELRDNHHHYPIEQCTRLFAEEIQRVELLYSDLKQNFNNKEFNMDYSSTNTGIETNVELDPSIFLGLLEYSTLNIDEIIDAWKQQSSDDSTLSLFLHLIEMYRSAE